MLLMIATTSDFAAWPSTKGVGATRFPAREEMRLPRAGGGSISTVISVHRKNAEVSQPLLRKDRSYGMTGRIPYKDFIKD
jgi:hypothetical protein